MRNRIFWIVLVLISFFSYLPVNRLVSGGYSLQTNLDASIQLVPIFIVPYFFAIFYWLGFIIYSNLKLKGELLKKINLSFIVAGFLSSLIYVVFPTFVIRPETIPDSIFSGLVNFVYINDHVYNAAPSGHTFFTIICFIFLYQINPKYKYLYLMLSILIIASTLFTKQHNVLDVATGTVFALLVYGIVTMYINSRHKVK